MNILSATNTKVKVRKQCDLKLVVNDAPNVAITMGDHINANANFRGEQQDVTTWDSRICWRTSSRSGAHGAGTGGHGA